MAELRIIEQTATVIHLEVETTAGTVEVVADIAWFADAKRLVLDQAHIQGTGPNTVGRAGLNEVKAALAEFGGQYGAETVILQGATRRSGRLLGTIPNTIIIPC